jgi:hypothetical protein
MMILSRFAVAIRLCATVNSCRQANDASVTTHPGGVAISTTNPRSARRLLRSLTLAAVVPALLLALTAAPAHSFASEPCPNEAVRGESNTNITTGKPYSSELPDCRAYELVSSPDKGDSDAMLSPLITAHHVGLTPFGLVSEDGGQLLWEKEFEPYSDPNNGEDDVYEASRGSSGWSQSNALVPPGTGNSLSLEIAAASGDFSTVLLRSTPDRKGSSTTEGDDQLVERASDGAYTTVVSVPASVEQFRVQHLYAQLSPDGSHAFFQTEAQLAGDTHIVGRQVYEWSSGGGLHVVGVDNAGNPVSACGAVLAGGSTLSYPDVSQNGSRVFFESPEPNGAEALTIREIHDSTVSEECKRPQELYMRASGGTTVEISKAPPSASECEPGVTECAATFVGATRDGSKVFFVTRTHLTAENANNDSNLYEYDTETGIVNRLSLGPSGYDDANVAVPTPRPGHGGAVGGTTSEKAAETAVASSDGSHVYFTGLGQLVPGAGASAATNEADETANLYVYSGGSVSFIATVGPGNWPGASNGDVSPNEAPLNVDVAEVTADGSDLIFDSDSQLTAYDNAGQGELYRYDASSRTISCISCSPTFATPNEPLDPLFHTSFWGDPNGSVQQFGGVSNDGETVFFASTDQLLPAATNVLAAEFDNPIYDIYEWHDGVLSLISSGTSPSSDFLIGASPSGSDAFFLSATQFVAQDGEHTYQIWDARTEGGFSAPAAPPAPCASAETCRSMEATPPTTITPATVSVSGPGNVATVTGTETLPTSKPKVESRSEKLRAALKACKRDKRESKRKSCERSAKKRYGPPKKK